MKTIYSMKHIILIIAAVISISVANAQTQQSPHELTIGGGAGFSGLQYKPAVGAKSLGFGGHFGIGYTYFFNNHVGLGTGVEIAFYNSTLRNGEFLNVITNVTDASDGRPYDFHSNVSEFNDKQKATYLNIPILFRFQTGGKHRFYAAAGAKIGIPLKGTSFATATFRNKGYFPHTDNWAETQQFRGFGTFTDRKTEEDLDLKVACLLSLEAGMKWKLNEKTALYTGIFFDYGVNHIVKGDAKPVIDYFPTESGMDFTHHGALTSNYTNGTTVKPIAEKVVPMAVGVKLNLAVGFIKSKKEPQVVEKIVEVEKVVEKIVEVEKLVEVEKEVVVEKIIRDTIFVTHEKEEAIAIISSITIVDGYSISESLLSETSQAKLDTVVALMLKHKDINVTCEGHTCDIDSDEVNERIGNQRAMTVKNYLMQHGIEERRITTLSKGKKEPIVPNTSEENRKLNRRVVLVAE